MNCPSCNKLTDLIKCFHPQKNLIAYWHCHECQLEIKLTSNNLYHPHHSQFEELPYQKNRHKKNSFSPYHG